MKLRAVLAFVVSLLALNSFSQKVLDIARDYFPNSLDSNNAYVFINFSCFFSQKWSEDATKSRYPSRNLPIKGDRVYQGEMEMLLFFLHKYEARFHPHTFVRVQWFANHLSSHIGLGVADKKTRSSFGLFYGQYYRRVPYGGNFVSKTHQRYEYYPLSGFYLQSRNDHSAFFYSLSRERKKSVHFLRASSLLGNTLMLGKEQSVLRSIEAVLLYEDFSGLGYGLSFYPRKNARVEFFYITPNEKDKDDQSQIGQILTSGFLLKLGYVVN